MSFDDSPYDEVQEAVALLVDLVGRPERGASTPSRLRRRGAVTGPAPPPPLPTSHSDSTPTEEATVPLADAIESSPVPPSPSVVAERDEAGARAAAKPESEPEAAPEPETETEHTDPPMPAQEARQRPPVEHEPKPELATEPAATRPSVSPPVSSADAATVDTAPMAFLNSENEIPEPAETDPRTAEMVVTTPEEEEPEPAETDPRTAEVVVTTPEEEEPEPAETDPRTAEVVVTTPEEEPGPAETGASVGTLATESLPEPEATTEAEDRSVEFESDDDRATAEQETHELEGVRLDAVTRELPKPAATSAVEQPPAAHAPIALSIEEEDDDDDWHEADLDETAAGWTGAATQASREADNATPKTPDDLPPETTKNYFQSRIGARRKDNPSS